MAKLIFFYSAMKGGKSNILIPTAYNLKENNQRVMIVKPKIDTAGGKKIVSRSGSKADIDLWLGKEESFLSDTNLALIYEVDTILIDEIQFLSSRQIEELWQITKELDVQVIGYGLCANFQSNLFEGSKRLFELADEISELPIIPLCHCGEKAKFNARQINGYYTMQGEECVIKDSNQEITYIPLCGKCYLNEVIFQNHKMKPIKKIEKKM